MLKQPQLLITAPEIYYFFLVVLSGVNVTLKGKLTSVHPVGISICTEVMFPR